MIIPFTMIDEDTLLNLIEEFVSRDGTDNGYDKSLNDKVSLILSKLRSGEIVVAYDSASESVNIVSREDAVVTTER
ncbi:hypothetical protein ACH42_11095 [Endozoicomonas sp. (ex Bugula neritina AB1)]|nr:hypothetical protein ACH42_11095 [Endozoicomonas sp. (ex Bugula neritina AB1)]